MHERERERERERNTNLLLNHFGSEFKPSNVQTARQTARQPADQ